LPAPLFYYFDLGNVLLMFDHRRGARQMAELAGVDAELVWRSVFASDLQYRYEAGQIDCDAFYRAFCQATKSRPPQEELLLAAGAIFEANVSIFAIVAMLQSANYRTGVLSNTCKAHWDHCIAGRYGMLPGAFEQIVLSYEAASMKPERRIYDYAIERAGVPAGSIFFIDDREENVAGALAAGLDAVHYTSASACAADLRKRGVEFNY
jgi:putative hydrolase of the HAD superfamily